MKCGLEDRLLDPSMTTFSSDIDYSAVNTIIAEYCRESRAELSAMITGKGEQHG